LSLRFTEHDEGDVHVPAEMVKPYFYSHHQGMKSAQGSTLFQRKNARFNQLANAVSFLRATDLPSSAIFLCVRCVLFDFTACDSACSERARFSTNGLYVFVSLNVCCTAICAHFPGAHSLSTHTSSEEP
jgi:hypothetical protein